jgi:hypothetical protein
MWRISAQIHLVPPSPTALPLTTIFGESEKKNAKRMLHIYTTSHYIRWNYLSHSSICGETSRFTSFSWVTPWTGAVFWRGRGAAHNIYISVSRLHCPTECPAFGHLKCGHPKTWLITAAFRVLDFTKNISPPFCISLYRVALSAACDRGHKPEFLLPASGIVRFKITHTNNNSSLLSCEIGFLLHTFCYFLWRNVVLVFFSPKANPRTLLTGNLRMRIRLSHPNNVIEPLKTESLIGGTCSNYFSPDGGTLALHQHQIHRIIYQVYHLFI